MLTLNSVPKLWVQSSLKPNPPSLSQSNDPRHDLIKAINTIPNQTTHMLCEGFNKTRLSFPFSFFSPNEFLRNTQRENHQISRKSPWHQTKQLVNLSVHYEPDHVYINFGISVCLRMNWSQLWSFFTVLGFPSWAPITESSHSSDAWPQVSSHSYKSH